MNTTRPTRPTDCAFPSSENDTRGLSKREYFAAMALQGLLLETEAMEAVVSAVTVADELIKQLNKSHHE